MLQDSVSCPRCGTTIDIPDVHVPLRSSAATGSIFKRCPRCRIWNWMSLQPQEAT